MLLEDKFKKLFNKEKEIGFDKVNNYIYEQIQELEKIRHILKVQEISNKFEEFIANNKFKNDIDSLSIEHHEDYEFNINSIKITSLTKGNDSFRIFDIKGNYNKHAKEFVDIFRGFEFEESFVSKNFPIKSKINIEFNENAKEKIIKTLLSEELLTLFNFIKLENKFNDEENKIFIKRNKV